jgi:secreted PhoX family phosphatase
MDDGLLVPGMHDGMAAFPGPHGKTILIRNHELSPENIKHSPYGERNQLLKNLADEQLYDTGRVRTGLGGTTTLVYDTRSQSWRSISQSGRHPPELRGATP